MDGKTALLALLDESASYRETGFSIDLKKAPDRWHRCVSAQGLRESCAVMADALCGEYQSRYGREFLFSAPLRGLGDPVPSGRLYVGHGLSRIPEERYHLSVQPEKADPPLSGDRYLHRRYRQPPAAGDVRV